MGKVITWLLSRKKLKPGSNERSHECGKVERWIIHWQTTASQTRNNGPESNFLNKSNRGENWNVTKWAPHTGTFTMVSSRNVDTEYRKTAERWITIETAPNVTQKKKNQVRYERRQKGIRGEWILIKEQRPHRNRYYVFKSKRRQRMFRKTETGTSVSFLLKCNRNLRRQLTLGR